MKKKITDVFFDLDHTLWDFERNSALAFETILKKRKIVLNTDQFLQNYTQFNREYWERFRKGQITHDQLRYGRLKDSFESIQYSVTDTFIEEIAVDYIYYLPRFNHLIDGAIAVLNYLNPKYNLHIITNGFAGIQERKLKNSNILNYFKTITNSDNAGVKKPNPIIFNFALQMANTSCENSIMIGDCIEADVDGALDAGYDAIFFNENNVQIPDGIKTIHHLLELKNYL